MVQNNIGYDIVILGGGLAGLCLALQLKQELPKTSILVLEKRNFLAPVATHKIGESVSELGSYYFREMLDLKMYLDENQIRKLGIRFYFNDGKNNSIDQRVEFGSTLEDPFPTHQLDRGMLENFLVSKLIEMDVKVLLGATVLETEKGKPHQTTYQANDKNYLVTSRWIVDSTGRRGLIKQQESLHLNIPHQINSVWFRLNQEIDIQNWSNNREWSNTPSPVRSLATNHLVGKGYWIWIIRLISGATSVGIVADPRFHPFDQLNTFSKALNWIHKFEPHAGTIIENNKDKLLDFKVIKNFAYNSSQFYSKERWAVTGEAGAFLDPLYSPGSDFIALGNSWITQLVVDDLSGNHFEIKAPLFDLVHKELVKGWLNLYQDKYELFDNTQIMLYKICWDWATYWAIPCYTFANKGYTDIVFLKEFASPSLNLGNRFAILNQKMQDEFVRAHQFGYEYYQNHRINFFELNTLLYLQYEFKNNNKRKNLTLKIKEHLDLLEEFASGILSELSSLIHKTPEKMPFDPLRMSLSMNKTELEALSKNVSLIPSQKVWEDVKRLNLKHQIKTTKTHV